MYRILTALGSPYSHNLGASAKWGLENPIEPRFARQRHGLTLRPDEYDVAYLRSRGIGQIQ